MVNKSNCKTFKRVSFVLVEFEFAAVFSWCRSWDVFKWIVTGVQTCAFPIYPSIFCCLLLPCVKCGCIARRRFWNFCIYELLQPIIIQHRLHPVLPCNIIRAALKGILQSQSVERHLNFDPKKTLLQIRIPPTQNSTASMLLQFLRWSTIAPIPCRNYIIDMLYV